MKVVDEISTSVAANATSANVFAGRTYERAPFTGYLTVFSTASAAGLEEQFIVNGQAITGGGIPMNTNNRSPIVPDDLRVSEVPVYQGQLIQVRVANTTGGALVARHRIEIESA
jgi:hypothetical protein